jgi:hypothetical protein
MDPKIQEATDRLNRKPGVCIPWQEKVKDLPPVVANEELVKKIWENNDSLAYMYVWQMLLSF